MEAISAAVRLATNPVRARLFDLFSTSTSLLLTIPLPKSRNTPNHILTASLCTKLASACPTALLESTKCSPSGPNRGRRDCLPP